MIIRLLSILLFFPVLTSCYQQPENTGSDARTYYSIADSGLQTGGVRMIPVQSPNGTFKVWTKRIGNNPKLKVLLLNGGPGATHEYFECFENFLPAASVEFIYYDQLGCGNSDNPNDTRFWDLNRYVSEVEQVRSALGLNKENFILLGHSWGGILAMEYALAHQENLKGLVISNMMSSCPDYGKYAQEVLAKQMDPKILDTIRMLEANKDFSNPRYMELLMPHFYTKHILRLPLEQWPEPVNRSFTKMNHSLYETMQGPSEFGIAGKLVNWDRKADLPKITVPALIIGGAHDTMDPEHMKWMASQVKSGTYLHCANGSHMSFYDDQTTYFNGLLDFLKKL